MSSSRTIPNGRKTSARRSGADRSKARLAVPAGEEDRGILIGRVVEEVQKALRAARDRPELSAFPKFKNATLTLQTVITRSVGGKIKLWIFSFGKTWEKERSHELVLKLTPPPPATPGRRLMAERTLAQDLEDAIVEAALGVHNAEMGDPPLSLSTFKVTISFVVTEDGSAGFEFTISPVTLELKGELKKKAIHTIALEFER